MLFCARFPCLLEQERKRENGMMIYGKYIFGFVPPDLLCTRSELREHLASKLSIIQSALLRLLCKKNNPKAFSG
jgi:hypothetical protein